MTERGQGARIIPFPGRARGSADYHAEAGTALDTLQEALAVQAQAMADLRTALGRLSTELRRLHGTATGYRDTLGRIVPATKKSRLLKSRLP